MHKLFGLDAEQLLLGEASEMMKTAGAAADPGIVMHSEALAAFERLREDAAAAGFDLKIHSAFRSFERQLSIWNRKAAGELPVLDDASKRVDISTLSEHELMLQILRWSALPGASRHHWGSDIDYYESNAYLSYGKIDLIVQEYCEGGPFAEANRWIDSRIAQKKAYSFFRPYAHDRGGVNREPWHLSWAPLADVCQNTLSQSLLLKKLQASPLLLKDTVIEALPLIWKRYIINVERSQ